MQYQKETRHTKVVYSDITYRMEINGNLMLIAI